MRILVISDSHGFTGRLGTILMRAEAEDKLDAVIHLGDGYHDLADYAAHLPPVYQVAGNCDYFQRDTLAIHDFSKARLVLTHGHLQQVKSGTDALYSFALQQGAAAALYGHTHMQKMEWKNGVLLLNPGAASSGRYAILEINRLGALNPQLYGN